MTARDTQPPKAGTKRGARFTPGPWFVHDFTDAVAQNGHVPSSGDITVSGDHPATITVAVMGRALTSTFKEARANARLIASAPDLYGALREVIDTAGNPSPELLKRAAALLAQIDQGGGQ